MFAVCGAVAVTTETLCLVVDTPFVKALAIVLEKPLVTHLNNLAFDAVLGWNRFGCAIVLDDFGEVQHLLTVNYQN